MSTFDVTGLYNNKFKSINPNIISRLRNTLVKGMENQILLSKFIVIVTDDDLINAIKFRGSGFTEAIGKMIFGVMQEHDRAISLHKSYLPSKSKRADFPKIYWIQVLLHVNFPNNAARIKYNTAMRTMASHFENVQTLEMKKG